MVNGREQPAFAPIEVIDHLEAYAPFLYENKEAADADLNEDIQHLGVDRAEQAAANVPEDADGIDLDGDEDEDDNFYEEDTVYPCTVHADGSITTEFQTITRAQIFEAYGLPDPAAAATLGR